MSLHKLTAGSGYDYLTRQVARQDATETGYTGLASYYTAKGETPGVWVGAGMAGIEGLEAGDVVTADHMQSLFGAGHHPLAAQRTRELDLRIGRPGELRPTAAAYRDAVRLGKPYPVYASQDVSEFRVEVARRIAAVNEAAGLPGDWPIPAADRARIRTAVAEDLFRAEHGRDATDARELAATIARHSRPKTTAVAGFDLTFSPVKSVSTLWAVTDPTTAAAIERAHQAAVTDALGFIEQRALFTRMGSQGVRQVNVRGLVACAFTHRDSRAGDPDLHTHVAVANKVQTLAGKWLAIDGRILFKAAVAASETYNTALERHLVDALGVRFAERAAEDLRKRPVREIVGVDAALNQRFSKRRLSVEDRRKILAADFQRTHGRPPTPVETLQLAQQATLETREAKHEPRSLTQQRETWHAEAIEVLGTGQRLQQMIRGALNPPAAAHQLADSTWFARAADRVVAAMEGGRATWQYWHVYAEAQRQVRGAQVPTSQVGTVVDLLVGEVLDARSVSLACPPDGLTEPAGLRRADGSSVYTVAGADLFTSTKVMAAEQRLVAAAGRGDGFAADEGHVVAALAATEANGIGLNAGQITLVREMVTSGARLQLAIAPAGSGKTTAMRALAVAWTDAGGQLIGLAPSAAAADALRSQIDTRTDTGTDTGTDTQADTLAKLTHALATGDTPDWVAGIGPSTLVVIDEAGMADTLSLDAAVTYVLERGGSVRLVGDDKQLAAIGAGGVLRDIQATHGALQLTELVRFLDPAEAAASLALREGRTEALGFYLDRGRVHVGDLATITQDVFDAWQADRSNGLDSIMLAPTRELVSELNQRARTHRLTGVLTGVLSGVDPTQLGPVVRLADGNEASIGDRVITRSNDRTLLTSATDWVKNGDRWTILDLHPDGAMTVQHAQHGRTVRLPRSYVDASVELGYACTIHTAQGVTADSMHGLATGAESRQLLYTMLTRGKVANHVYLEVVGDGDPHSVIRPELVRPETPTDILEAILARDDAQRSATSLLRQQADQGLRLGEATARYTDSLYLAAEQLLGRDVVDALDQAVEALVPGLAEEPAWPTLRAHLLLLGAAGEDPVTTLTAALTAAAAERDLTTAHDLAAVLDWRLDASGHRNAGTGPLPWLPGIPTALADDPHWGHYLTTRAQLVADLADQVRDHALAADSRPAWAQNGLSLPAEVRGDVEVWRAAMQVPAEDRRATGAPQLQKAAATWQRRLTRQVAGDHTPALREWSHLLHGLAPQLGGDEFTALLAERLAAMSRAGLAAHQLLHAATGMGPLPDEHAAAALWWRLARHLTPATASQLQDHQQIQAGWVDQLVDLVGPGRAEHLQASTAWPALVANLDHGLQRGWRLEDLLSAATLQPVDGIDECQALVWRTSLALDPIPERDHHDYHYDPPPEDMWEGYQMPADTMFVDPTDPAAPAPPPAEPPDGPPAEPAEDAGEMAPDVVGVGSDEVELEQLSRELALAALVRDSGRTRLEYSEADIRRMYQRAEEWEHSPVTRDRLLEVNELTQQFFAQQFTDSWGRTYLSERFGMDLAGHEHYRPGQAPAGWNQLVAHLRRHGITDTEMLTAGVATTASTGRLIDRFRDRVMFPVVHHGAILGFVGRRRPELTEADKAGPKYLNTATTPLFHKGDQLFGLIDELIDAGATPALVEGPMDAIAVTLASAGRFVGVAPLGTSLTDEQATQLGTIGRDPVVATDADLAGHAAAERDFWLLTPHGLDPSLAQFPDGFDPADLLASRGPAALTAALLTGKPLGEHLLTERLDNLTPAAARTAAATVLAARPGHAWATGLDRITSRLQLSQLQARRDLRSALTSWGNDPRKVAASELANLSKIKGRLAAAAERWAALAGELDPRLATQPDWGATAALLQEAHEHGHDVTTAARELVAAAPLGERPARELRYRLVGKLDLAINTGEPPRRTKPQSSATLERRGDGVRPTPPAGGRQRSESR